MPDIEKMADEVFVAVRGYVSGLIGDIAKRMDTWEARLATIPAGPKGDKGEPGKDAESVNVGEIVARVAAALPEPVAGKDGAAGRDGIDGKDAESVDPLVLRGMIQGEVARAVAELPKPVDGKDGAAGDRGPVGASVKGDPGLPGKDGVNGMDGQPGRDGRDGLPGIAAKDGAPGLDGKDGKDGFSLEDFDVALSEDGRTLSLKFMRGEVAIERSIRLATMIYREVWREGEYDRGDVVTWGGSAWHCQEKTTDQPKQSAAWKMMVKEGRPGKDGAAPAPAAHKPVTLK